MYAVIQLKIPLDIALTLKRRLDELQTLHDRASKKATTPEEKDSIVALGSRLTINNLVRLTLEEGYGPFCQLPLEAVYDRLEKSQVAIARGRPRPRLVAAR